MRRSLFTALVLLGTALVVYLAFRPLPPPGEEISPRFPWEKAMAQYALVPLQVDLASLPDGERTALPALAQACRVMDRLFWLQSYGEPGPLLAQAPHKTAQVLLQANYGPWERLMNDAPLLPGVAARPLGGDFYPADLTKEEFAQDPNPKKNHPYSLLRRVVGRLTTQDYIHAYPVELAEAAQSLAQAATQVSHAGFARYLRLRSQALQEGDFLASELAWMTLNDNPLDLVIGPIETYEDRFQGIKAAYEGLILKRDFAWEARLGKLNTLLPALQKGLPVPAAYKAEPVGLASGLGAFDLVMACGMANAGPKALALNLPNDEKIQMQQGSRRLQFKNVMQAKFAAILQPLAQVLIHPSQRSHVTFPAFFDDTMLHEVGHGLGVKTLVGRRGKVKEALAEGIKPEDLFKYDFIERVSNEVQESAFAKDRELRERMLAQRDLSGLDPDCGEPVNSSGKADANESLKETLFGRRPKSN